MAFLERKIQPLPLNKVIVCSDGMGAQFDSRFVFVLLSKFNLTKSGEWHWNTAHYRKGLMGLVVLWKTFCVEQWNQKKTNSKNTRSAYQCCEFTNTIIINLFTSNRLLREPPEEHNAPPIPEKLQILQMYKKYKNLITDEVP